MSSASTSMIASIRQAQLRTLLLWPAITALLMLGVSAALLAWALHDARISDQLQNLAQRRDQQARQHEARLKADQADARKLATTQDQIGTALLRQASRGQVYDQLRDWAGGLQRAHAELAPVQTLTQLRQQALYEHQLQLTRGRINLIAEDEPAALEQLTQALARLPGWSTASQCSLERLDPREHDGSGAQSLAVHDPLAGTAAMSTAQAGAGVASHGLAATTLATSAPATSTLAASTSATAAHPALALSCHVQAYELLPVAADKRPPLAHAARSPTTAATPAHAAWGTLLLTATERQHAAQQRLTAAAPPPAAAAPQQLDGMVWRTGGPSAVWVNGRLQQDERSGVLGGVLSDVRSGVLHAANRAASHAAKPATQGETPSGWLTRADGLVHVPGPTGPQTRRVGDRWSGTDTPPQAAVAQGASITVHRHEPAVPPASAHTAAAATPATDR